MPGGVEFGDESTHVQPRRPVHQCCYSDVGTEARVVARAASHVSMAAGLEIGAWMAGESQFCGQGSGKLTEIVRNNVAVRVTP